MHHYCLAALVRPTVPDHPIRIAGCVVVVAAGHIVDHIVVADRSQSFAEETTVADLLVLGVGSAQSP
nr:hypothetical protein [uncultured organism]